VPQGERASSGGATTSRTAPLIPNGDDGDELRRSTAGRAARQGLAVGIVVTVAATVVVILRPGSDLLLLVVGCLGAVIAVGIGLYHRRRSRPL
jgi:hypothetical protein